MEEYELIFDNPAYEASASKIFNDYDKVDFDDSGEPLFDSYEEEEDQEDEEEDGCSYW